MSNTAQLAYLHAVIAALLAGCTITGREAEFTSLLPEGTEPPWSVVAGVLGALRRTGYAVYIWETPRRSIEFKAVKW